MIGQRRSKCLGPSGGNSYVSLLHLTNNRSPFLPAIIEEMSTVFSDGQLDFARKELRGFLTSYEEHAVQFADQEWSKELVRLAKDAIRECGYGRHALGKYAVLKLRDTAMNWYKGKSITTQKGVEMWA
jgi:hypothetical protein